MSAPVRRIFLFAALAALAIGAPLLLPDYRTQMALLWVMVIFALTWDVVGGQMGYNSFGNIFFFGVGMYACAVVQRDAGLDYYAGLAAGVALGTLLAVVAAAVIGAGLLGLRGHYFAIGTLGLGIAAAEIAASWDYIGAGVRPGHSGLPRRHPGSDPVLLLALPDRRRAHLLHPALAVRRPFRARDQRDP